MRIDAVLTLTQWFSPAYPVGAFGYSHGLEAAVEAGEVSDAASLQAWLRDILEHGTGRADALFLAASHAAESMAEVETIDTTCRAFASSAERLAETTLQGAAFCEITTQVWDHADLSAFTYPVAAGRAARLCDLPLDLTSAFYLQAFAANLVAAGQRLAPVGQAAAQQILRLLAPLCSRIAQQTQDGDLSTLSNTVFLADIASMHHETQYSRIFRT
jgi:urease accessory protein